MMRADYDGRAARLLGMFLIGLAILSTEVQLKADILYVDSLRAEGGGGSSWEDALRCPVRAIDLARAGDQIWVKAGIYPLNEPIRPASGVAIYGGFEGSERSAAERSEVNSSRQTVLRQERSGASVVALIDVTGVRLDGLTLTGANGAAGLLLDGCGEDVELASLRVERNTSPAPGAGLRVLRGSFPRVFNCRIADNLATHEDGGGGLYIDETSGGTFSYCILSGNTTQGKFGGGALIGGEDRRPVRFSRSAFYFNESGVTGSAIDAGGLVELRDSVTSSNLAREAAPGHAIRARDNRAEIVLTGHSYVVSNLADREEPVFVRGIDGDGRYKLEEEALIHGPQDEGNADLAYFTARNDLHTVLQDVFVPDISSGPPGPGRRVRQTLPEYAGTEAYHCIYLPVDWQPDGRYPVVVGFPGNGPFRNRFGDRSGGMPEDNPMGYGISGGKGFIVLDLGYLDSRNNLRPTGSWWGDVGEAIAYTKAAVQFVCNTYGGDPGAVILYGFSRSAIGVSFIGLHDDGIASLWRAFLCYDGWESQADMERDWYRYGRSSYGYDPADFDGTGVSLRFARLAGRPLFIIGGRGQVEALNAPHDFPVQLMSKTHRNHNASWALRNTPERAAVRDWLFREVGLVPDPSE